MIETIRRHSGWTALLVTGLLVGGLAACDGSILDVEDPDVVQPDEQLSPSSVPARFGGMINDFREMYEDYILYTGLMTDEFILAGTFPTRIEVDERRPISNNGSINGDVWQPLQVARAQADAVDQQFTESLDDEEFADIQGDLQQGIAWAKLLGGYTRIFFAEFFCQSIFGGDPDLVNFGDLPKESSPKNSTERMQEALALLEDAEAFASSAGLTDVATAARVGQGRAHLFLGNYPEAANAVSTVPTDFTFHIDYSSNTLAEENEVFWSTWGVNASIRWTVGDGTDASRTNEVFAYLGAPEDTTTDPDTPATGWIGQGLVIPPAIAEGPAEKSPFNGRSPVNLQTLYGGRSGTTGSEAPIVLASGWEARMIEAEDELRNGNPEVAEDDVNALLEDEDQVNNPITFVQPDLTSPPGGGDFATESLGAFPPVDFGDEPLQGDLVELARARESGLWLLGDRQATSRRFAQEFNDRSGLGLYPDKPGDAISLPVPAQEVDNNDAISNACPAGLP